MSRPQMFEPVYKRLKPLGINKLGDVKASSGPEVAEVLLEELNDVNLHVQVLTVTASALAMYRGGGGVHRGAVDVLQRLSEPGMKQRLVKNTKAWQVKMGWELRPDEWYADQLLSLYWELAEAVVKTFKRSEDEAWRGVEELLRNEVVPLRIRQLVAWLFRRRSRRWSGGVPDRVEQWFEELGSFDEFQYLK